MNKSSYLSYLPPVLWSKEHDPSQFLGYMLRIFEKILTGFSVNTRARRAMASIKTASNDRIEVTDEVGANNFQPGDIINIEGTPEQKKIADIRGTEIFLDSNLSGNYNAGTVRIADLLSGQKTFRVMDVDNLGPGSIIEITQHDKAEDGIVSQVRGDFITLTTGLINTFAMADTYVPVRIKDKVAIIHKDHQHDSFEKAIDELYQIFNPFLNRSDFLSYLASWVALPLEEGWSQYQKRKLISEIVSIYEKRGLKEGLYTYLDVFAATEANPRIVIDDGDALYLTTLKENDTASLHAIFQSISVSRGPETITALLHPTALAVDSKNNYIIADDGDDSLTLSIPRYPSLWKVTNTGEIEYKLTPHGQIPMPIYVPKSTDSVTLNKPTALVIDSQEQYFVLDAGPDPLTPPEGPGIYRFSPPAYVISKVIDQSTTPKFDVVNPVDMVLDGNDNFVVLDRGRLIDSDPPNPTVSTKQKIVVVSENPLTIKNHKLNIVKEPTAIVMDSTGRYIVADAKDQNTAAPADLIRVDPSAGWSEKSLLSGVPDNPLVFPAGLVFENPQSLIVCDTGVRWGFSGDVSNRIVAESPGLYRVDLSGATPVITRLTIDRKLVNPTKIAIDHNKKLIITDRGESCRSVPPKRNWRAGANEFGVIVHFSQQRPTTDEERIKIMQEIQKVVEEEKPAHTYWWLKSR